MTERVEFLLLLMLALSLYYLGVGSESSLFVSKLQERCSVEEREALLNFKRSLYDPYHLLSTWELGEDCCTWKGIGCSNTTNHVIKLDFTWSYTNFIGNIDFFNGEEWPFYATSLVPSFFRLQYLEYLSLSGIFFYYISLPQSINSLINLRYLDLSDSCFSGVIPPHLGNLTNLQHLDLRGNFLVASNLLWMSRLSSLQYLDMSFVNLTLATNWLHEIRMLPALSTLKLEWCNLQALPTLLPYSNLSSTIEIFSLSGNQFPNSIIPSWLSNMTNLVKLGMFGCQLRGMIPSNFLGALCKLTKLILGNNLLDGSISSMFLDQSPRCTAKYELTWLDLSSNHLSGSLPNWLGKFKSLYTLYLGSNKFTGTISSASLNLLCDISVVNLSENNFTELIDDGSASSCNACKIAVLDISSNHLIGSIPEWVGQMRNLVYLDLHYNRLSGSIPQSLGQLINLTYLDLSINLLQGTLSDVNFANLSKLRYMYLSHNNLHFNMSLNWVPPFQASTILLSSCFIGPRFPQWLETQKFISILDISNASISDIIPSWFWNISSQILCLNMSHNLIRGKLPMSLNIRSPEALDLGSNLFEGHLPRLTSSIIFASFSDNKFSDGIEWYLNANMSSLAVLYLSHNHLSGEIPDSICQLPSIILLDISHCNLSGEIPKCQGNISGLMMLRFINLANNNLWGSIPQWIGNLSSLMSLYLSNNNFQGEIPLFINHSKLITLDLGQNKLTGNIPLWIGDRLSSLKILRLRSNSFHGSIPSELSKLKRLQILDIANNFLSGTLPKSFKFFSSMITPNKSFESLIPEEVTSLQRVFSVGSPRSLNIIFQDSLMIAVKGIDREFTNILSLVIVMDLSCNNLTGEVPDELMSLIGLRSLNLSKNQFTGHIPINIDAMQSLESLDLSRNHFSGEIPESIVKLSALNHLNLSYNQLSGRIPTGTQLDSFDESSYYGNPKLCGKPLLKTCESDEHNIHYGRSNSHDDDNSDLFLSMGLGFAVGLWSILGTLLLKRSWAITYFQLYDNITNNIYVFVVVRVNKWFYR